MKNFKLSLVTLVFLFTGCAYLNYLKDPFVDIPNLRQVKPHIYSGGLPKPQGLDFLKELKTKTIISFRSEIPEYEQNFIQENNINLIRIPLSIYKKPTDEQVFLFLETMINKNNLPIYIHCKDGRDRTGAMIAVYRTIVDGLGPKESYKEALKFGFWPYRGDDILKDYIHQLKDKKEFFIFAQELKQKQEVK